MSPKNPISLGDTIPTDSEIEWTCKKCTLVNNGTSNVCIVCGGSKLRSITSVEDLTLRKGEFWSCSQCTLKNSLASHACSACKATRQSSAHMSRQPNNTAAAVSPNAIPANGGGVNATNMKNSSSQASISGSSSNSSSGNNKQHSNIVGSGSNHNNLMPPVNRVSRSPSRNDRLSSGAIPKVRF